MPQKLKKRRILQHLNTNSYRSFRRKAKTPLSSTSNTSTRAADKSDSSSDDDHDDNDLYDRHMPSTSTAPLDINMPSTSTGITANGKGYSFRIATNNNDSDDDQSIPDQLNPSSDNMLRVIRSPPIQSNNSAHYQNISDDEDDDDDENTTERPRNIFNMPSRHQPPKEPHHNGRKKLRANEVNEESSSTNHGEEDYASTNSNSLQSSTSDDGGSNDSFIEFNSRKRKLSAVAEEDHTNGNARNFHLTYSNINNISNSTSGNSFNGQFETPSTKIRNSRGSSTVTTTTPDSGFRSLISPSSSTSQAPANGNRMNGSKQEMMKKIDNIKRNYRKNLQEDDDDSD